MPSSRRPRHFDSPHQETYLSLWRTYDQLRAIEEELFSQHDITAQQYNTLRLLRGEHPDAVPTLELAGRLISHAPDITRLLDKLEQRGFIQRERPQENRRQVLIRISNEGLEFLQELDEPVRACHEKQLGHLDAAQLQQLNELLRLIRRRHEPDGSPWR
jgi:DNA-binding MarR family transcriptional regulator